MNRCHTFTPEGTPEYPRASYPHNTCGRCGGDRRRPLEPTQEERDREEQDYLRERRYEVENGGI